MRAKSAHSSPVIVAFVWFHSVIGLKFLLWVTRRVRVKTPNIPDNEVENRLRNNLGAAQLLLLQIFLCIPGIVIKTKHGALPAHEAGISRIVPCVIFIKDGNCFGIDSSLSSFLYLKVLQESVVL